MTSFQRDWWKREREKGFAHFFWRYGILKFGLFYGIVMSVLTALIDRRVFEPLEFVLTCGFYVFFFGGSVSVFYWYWYERDYRRAHKD
jgi:hypothetical protein